MLDGSTVGLVTDSVSQIPDVLAHRLGVAVVPITVTLDDVDFREGADLSADEFWDRTKNEPDLAVTTTQPSPGEFVEVYSKLIGAGATAIVSIHVSPEYSGTLNSARVAANEVDVPVHLVDSQNASFGITGCVWAAADSRAVGDPADVVAAKAVAAAAVIGTSFILDGLDQAKAVGRLGAFDTLHQHQAEKTAVFAGHGTALEMVGEGRSVDELCDLMAAQFCGHGRVRIGLSLADPLTEAYSEGLEQRLRRQPEIVEIVHYRVGPSVAAYTGPGTAGGYWFPV